MNTFLKFLYAHKWAIGLTVFAAVVLTLLLSIGFWKTLLIVGLIGIAFFVGYIADKFGFSWFAENLSKLLKK